MWVTLVSSGKSFHLAIKNISKYSTGFDEGCHFFEKHALILSQYLSNGAGRCSSGFGDVNKSSFSLKVGKSKSFLNCCAVNATANLYHLYTQYRTRVYVVT